MSCGPSGDAETDAVIAAAIIAAAAALLGALGGAVLSEWLGRSRDAKTRRATLRNQVRSTAADVIATGFEVAAAGLTFLTLLNADRLTTDPGAHEVTMKAGHTWNAAQSQHKAAIAAFDFTASDPELREVTAGLRAKLAAQADSTSAAFLKGLSREKPTADEMTQVFDYFDEYKAMVEEAEATFIGLLPERITD